MESPKARTGWACRSLALLPLLVLIAGHARAGTLAPALRALARHGIPPGAEGRVPASPWAPRIDRKGLVQVAILPVRPRGPLPPALKLVALGAKKIEVSSLLDEIQAWVPVGKLTALAALPDVGFVRVPTYAMVIGPPARPPLVATAARPALAKPVPSSPLKGRKGSGGVGLLALLGLGFLAWRRRGRRPAFCCPTHGSFPGRRASWLRSLGPARTGRARVRSTPRP